MIDDVQPSKNEPTPEQLEAIAARMAEKQAWKNLPGNRFTPEELDRMLDDARNGKIKVEIMRRTPIIYVA